MWKLMYISLEVKNGPSTVILTKFRKLSYKFQLNFFPNKSPKDGSWLRISWYQTYSRRVPSQVRSKYHTFKDITEWVILIFHKITIWLFILSEGGNNNYDNFCSCSGHNLSSSFEKNVQGWIPPFIFHLDPIFSVDENVKAKIQGRIVSLWDKKWGTALLPIHFLIQNNFKMAKHLSCGPKQQHWSQGNWEN